MSSWFLRIALLLLLGVGVALTFETRRLAELLGDAERQALQATERADAAERQLAAAAVAVPEVAPVVGPGVVESVVGEPGVGEPGAAAAEPVAASVPEPAAGVATKPIDLDEFSRLKLALHESEQHRQTLQQLLEQRNEEQHQRAAEAAERSAMFLRAMPAGVRRCLQTLHECFLAEGYHQQRFLRAGVLDDEGLHDIELLETSDDGLQVAFVSARLMTARVDRAAGRLELRFFDGHRSVGGERAQLPEEGFLLAFDEVDGRLFERRLPYLVRGEGSYPVPADPDARPATDVDPGTRRQWLTRIKLLLAQAETDLHWRATRLRGMQDGRFLTVELVGTTSKGLVVGSAHCDRLAVEVDERAGVVSLLLQDGVLRRQGVESTITARGFRMLLPGLTPKDATDAMLGMVVRK